MVLLQKVIPGNQLEISESYQKAIEVASDRLIAFVRRTLMSDMRAEESITFLFTNQENKMFLPEEQWEKGLVLGVDGTALGGAVARLKASVAHFKGILPLWAYLPKDKGLALAVHNFLKKEIDFVSEAGERVANYGVIPYLLNNRDVLYYTRGYNVLIVPETYKYFTDPKKNDCLVPIFGYDGTKIERLTDVLIRVDFTKAAGSRNFIAHLLPHCGGNIVNNSALLKADENGDPILTPELRGALDGSIKLVKGMFEEKYLKLNEEHLDVKASEGELARRERIAEELAETNRRTAEALNIKILEYEKVTGEKFVIEQELGQATQELTAAQSNVKSLEEARIRSEKRKVEDLRTLRHDFKGTLGDASKKIENLIEFQEIADKVYRRIWSPARDGLDQLNKYVAAFEKSLGKLPEWKNVKEALENGFTIASEFAKQEPDVKSKASLSRVGTSYRSILEGLDALLDNLDALDRRLGAQNSNKSWQVFKSLCERFASVNYSFGLSLLAKYYAPALFYLVEESRTRAETFINVMQGKDVIADALYSIDLLSELRAFALGASNEDVSVAFSKSPSISTNRLTIEKVMPLYFNQRVLGNMYDNSVEAGATKISLQVGLEESAGGRSFAVLTYRDNGSGVPQDLVGVFLERGFSTKKGAWVKLSEPLTTEEQAVLAGYAGVVYFPRQNILRVSEEFNQSILDKIKEEQALLRRAEVFSDLWEKAKKKNAEPQTRAGSGLGTDDMVRVIENAGGTVTATSVNGTPGDPGVGTVFTIRLPIKPTDEKILMISEVELKKRRKFPEDVLPPRILIVDDREEYRSPMQAVFTDFQEVLTATNGQEAIDLLSRLEPRDKILLDIDMPILNGFGVLRWMKEHGCEQDVLVYTGAPEDHEKELGSPEYRQVQGILPKTDSPLKVHDEMVDITVQREKSTW